MYLISRVAESKAIRYLIPRIERSIKGRVWPGWVRIASVIFLGMYLRSSFAPTWSLISARGGTATTTKSSAKRASDFMVQSNRTSELTQASDYINLRRTNQVEK